VFQLSVRNAFRYRKEGRSPLCTLCRRPSLKMSDEGRADYIAWWIERSGLSRAELREIAVGLG
jgi:hypothetical protein